MNLEKSDREKHLFDLAMRRWGLPAIYGMVMEECGELITALNQYNRGRVNDDKVVEELADVLILIAQMSVVFGEKNLELAVERKMLRLVHRLENCENI